MFGGEGARLCCGSLASGELVLGCFDRIWLAAREACDPRLHLARAVGDRVGDRELKGSPLLRQSMTSRVNENPRGNQELTRTFGSHLRRENCSAGDGAYLCLQVGHGQAGISLDHGTVVGQNTPRISKTSR